MSDPDMIGGEELSLDEAATRFASLSTPEAVSNDPAEDETETDEALPDDELLADDAAGENEDGETTEDDQADDGEDDETNDQGRFVSDTGKVRLDNGQIVSIAELKRSPLLQADYTRKTQEAAETMRAAQVQSERIQQTEQALLQMQQFAMQVLQEQLPPKPSLKDYQNDPWGFTQANAAYEEAATRLNALASHNQALANQRMQEQSVAAQQRIQQESEALLKVMPELRDEKRRNAFYSSVMEHGPQYGYSVEELQSLVDHRGLRVLRDAIAYRNLKAKQPQVQAKVDGRPPVVKGGKRLTPDAQRARNAASAMNRLQQTGRVDDAVAAYIAKQSQG